MLKPVIEGQLNVFLRSDTVLAAGQLVKLDTTKEGYIVTTGAGDSAYGIVAQDVVANTDGLNSVSAEARIGDKVGVYFGSGIYYTDKIATAVTVGATLYVGANGLLTTDSATGTNVKFAIAETAGSAGSKVRIRVL